MSHEHRVIIIDGGFGGLRAAGALKAAPVDVTLIGRRNFHLFQSLLHQVATGSLSPGEIAAPLRSVLRRQENTRVLLGEAVDIDPASKGRPGYARGARRRNACLSIPRRRMRASSVLGGTPRASAAP